MSELETYMAYELLPIIEEYALSIGYSSYDSFRYYCISMISIDNYTTFLKMIDKISKKCKIVIEDTFGLKGDYYLQIIYKLFK